MHKVGRIILLVLVVGCLLVSAFSVIALAQNNGLAENTGYEHVLKGNFVHNDGKCEKFKCNPSKKHKDPVKALEEKKEEVKDLLKQGKITEEEADELIKKIDDMIKKIEEFNRLPLEKKKEVLINKFKEHVEKKVDEGKLTREKADEIIKEHIEKINRWNGKGYPDFKHKGKIQREKKNKREKPES